MRTVTASEISDTLTYPALIAALEAAFRSDIVVPLRHHHAISRDGADAMLLLMPAWDGGGGTERFLGCKIVTVFPTNLQRGEPSVHGSYILMSGETGEPLAVMDARVLTA